MFVKTSSEKTGLYLKLGNKLQQKTYIVGTQKILMRCFFWVPKTYAKTDGQESIYNFKIFCEKEVQ